MYYYKENKIIIDRTFKIWYARLLSYIIYKTEPTLWWHNLQLIVLCTYGIVCMQLGTARTSYRPVNRMRSRCAMHLNNNKQQQQQQQSQHKIYIGNVVKHETCGCPTVCCVCMLYVYYTGTHTHTRR